MLDRATLILIEALMSNATKRRVRSSKQKVQCVRVDCTDPSERGCRGCCKLHYNQFDYAKRMIEKQSDKELFDAQEVAAGNVLPSARGKCRKRANPYLKAV
jgi:hypothetical protein